jgi:hypothetical protein
MAKLPSEPSYPPDPLLEPIEIDIPLTSADFLPHIPAGLMLDPLTGPQPSFRRPFYRNRKSVLDRFMDALLRVRGYIASPPPLFQVRAPSPSRYSR